MKKNMFKILMLSALTPVMLVAMDPTSEGSAVPADQRPSEEPVAPGVQAVQEEAEVQAGQEEAEVPVAPGVQAVQEPSEEQYQELEEALKNPLLSETFLKKIQDVVGGVNVEKLSDLGGELSACVQVKGNSAVNSVKGNSAQENSAQENSAVNNAQQRIVSNIVKLAKLSKEAGTGGTAGKGDTAGTAATGDTGGTGGTVNQDAYDKIQDVYDKIKAAIAAILDAEIKAREAANERTAAPAVVVPAAPVAAVDDLYQGLEDQAVYEPSEEQYQELEEALKDNGFSNVFLKAVKDVVKNAKTPFDEIEGELNTCAVAPNDQNLSDKQKTIVPIMMGLIENCKENDTVNQEALDKIKKAIVAILDAAITEREAARRVIVNNYETAPSATVPAVVTREDAKDLVETPRKVASQATQQRERSLSESSASTTSTVSSASTTSTERAAVDNAVTTVAPPPPPASQPGSQAVTTVATAADSQSEEDDEKNSNPITPETFKQELGLKLKESNFSPFAFVTIRTMIKEAKTPLAMLTSFPGCIKNGRLHSEQCDKFREIADYIVDYIMKSCAAFAVDVDMQAFDDFKRIVVKMLYDAAVEASKPWAENVETAVQEAVKEVQSLGLSLDYVGKIANIVRTANTKDEVSVLLKKYKVLLSTEELNKFNPVEACIDYYAVNCLFCYVDNSSEVLSNYKILMSKIVNALEASTAQTAADSSASTTSTDSQASTERAAVDNAVTTVATAADSQSEEDEGESLVAPTTATFVQGLEEKIKHHKIASNVLCRLIGAIDQGETLEDMRARVNSVENYFLLQREFSSYIIDSWSSNEQWGGWEFNDFKEVVLSVLRIRMSGILDEELRKAAFPEPMLEDMVDMMNGVNMMNRVDMKANDAVQKMVDLLDGPLKKGFLRGVNFTVTDAMNSFLSSVKVGFLAYQGDHSAEKLLEIADFRDAVVDIIQRVLNERRALEDSKTPVAVALLRPPFRRTVSSASTGAASQTIVPVTTVVPPLQQATARSGSQAPTAVAPTAPRAWVTLAPLPLQQATAPSAAPASKTVVSATLMTAPPQAVTTVVPSTTLAPPPPPLLVAATAPSGSQAPTAVAPTAPRAWVTSAPSTTLAPLPLPVGATAPSDFQSEVYLTDLYTGEFYPTRASAPSDSQSEEDEGESLVAPTIDTVKQELGSILQKSNLSSGAFFTIFTMISEAKTPEEVLNSLPACIEKGRLYNEQYDQLKKIEEYIETRYTAYIADGNMQALGVFKRIVAQMLDDAAVEASKPWAKNIEKVAQQAAEGVQRLGLSLDYVGAIANIVEKAETEDEWRDLSSRYKKSLSREKLDELNRVEECIWYYTVNCLYCYKGLPSKVLSGKKTLMREIVKAVAATKAVTPQVLAAAAAAASQNVVVPATLMTAAASQASTTVAADQVLAAAAVAASQNVEVPATLMTAAADQEVAKTQLRIAYFRSLLRVLTHKVREMASQQAAAVTDQEVAKTQLRVAYFRSLLRVLTHKVRAMAPQQAVTATPAVTVPTASQDQEAAPQVLAAAAADQEVAKTQLRIAYFRSLLRVLTYKVRAMAPQQAAAVTVPTASQDQEVAPQVLAATPAAADQEMAPQQATASQDQEVAPQVLAAPPAAADQEVAPQVLAAPSNFQNVVDEGESLKEMEETVKQELGSILQKSNLAPLAFVTIREMIQEERTPEEMLNSLPGRSVWFRKFFDDEQYDEFKRIADNIVTCCTAYIADEKMYPVFKGIAVQMLYDATVEASKLLVKNVEKTAQQAVEGVQRLGLSLDYVGAIANIVEKAETEGEKQELLWQYRVSLSSLSYEELDEFHRVVRCIEYYVESYLYFSQENDYERNPSELLSGEKTLMKEIAKAVKAATPKVPTVTPSRERSLRGTLESTLQSRT